MHSSEQKWDLTLIWPFWFDHWIDRQFNEADSTDIWVSFLSEIDLKVTKMAFKAKTCGKIFSKVVFTLVPMDIYYPIPFVSQLHFGLPTDISNPLWYIMSYDTVIIVPWPPDNQMTVKKSQFWADILYGWPLRTTFSRSWGSHWWSLLKI